MINRGQPPPGRVPTAAELKAQLPPLRRFIVRQEGVEHEVLAHETTQGYAAAFTRYIVIGDGQMREQLVASFIGGVIVVREDNDLPFDADRSPLALN